jgi:ubiquitin-activating enzyme E1
VSLEVIKSITGKLTPIHQWMYWEAKGVIPDGITDADRKPIGSRYDPQIAVYGKALQSKLSQQKVMQLGAGSQKFSV